MHVTDRIKRSKRTPRGVWHVGDMSLQKNFRPEITFGAVCWGETARVG